MTRLHKVFETISPSGHHGPDLYYAPRPDGSCTLRVASGDQFLDVPLTASQVDELATVLLQGLHDFQRRWPDAASWQPQRNS